MANALLGGLTVLTALLLLIMFAAIKRYRYEQQHHPHPHPHHDTPLDPIAPTEAIPLATVTATIAISDDGETIIGTQWYNHQANDMHVDLAQKFTLAGIITKSAQDASITRET